MTNQFLTTCKRCGQPILMTKCENKGIWIPCEPKERRFVPSGGPDTYVNEFGMLCRGKRNPNGEIGYKKHLRSCVR